MKINKTFAAILAMVALPSLADVEALYWQVTSGDGGNNTAPIEFAAAAMVADNGSTKVYLNDINGNAWQAANSDKVTTESIASIWSDTYATGYTFYIELMNNDNGNWYTAGTIDSGSGNWSYDDIKSHIYSSSSMSMSLATPITSGTAHIPEPTSGLLMLVGGALLALRRRRV